MAEDTSGASNSASSHSPLLPFDLANNCGLRTDERLLAAAREDNMELLLDIFEKGGFDINHQDG